MYDRDIIGYTSTAIVGTSPLLDYAETMRGGEDGCSSICSFFVFCFFGVRTDDKTNSQWMRFKRFYIKNTLLGVSVQ